jgi:hypothetical protein
MNNPTWAPGPRTLVTPMPDGTAVLLHLDTRFYYTLNATGRCMWDRISTQPRPDLEALVACLCAAFEVGADEARQDAQALIDELVAERLVLIDHGATPTPTTG